MKNRIKFFIVCILILCAFFWIYKTSKQEEIALFSQPMENVASITITPQSDLIPDKKISISQATPQMQQLLDILNATQDLQVVKNPDEQTEQNSDPAYYLQIQYKDGMKENIFATETGTFLYRLINDKGGWVGGHNEKILPYLQALLQGLK